MECAFRDVSRLIEGGFLPAGMLLNNQVRSETFECLGCMVRWGAMPGIDGFRKARQGLYFKEWAEFQ